MNMKSAAENTGRMLGCLCGVCNQPVLCTEQCAYKCGEYMVTFNVKCTMRVRWATQFLGMLKYMQKLGESRQSRQIGFFAEGGGTFQPKFELPPDVSVGEPAAIHERGRISFDVEPLVR